MGLTLPRLDRWLLGLGAAALLGLVCLFAYAPIFAVDFFWQLELGKLIAEQHAIPRTDLFSAVHPDRPYVQFQWLWELLAYGAYCLHGLAGVRLFQVGTLLASFVALGWVSLRALPSRALALAFCALALVLFEDRFQTRPSATVLGFVALSLPWLLVPGLRGKRLAWLGALALGCLWSNIHAGESLLFLLCLAALTVGALLERWLQGDTRRCWRDATLLLAAALGTVCSPAFAAGLSAWSHALGPVFTSGNKEFRPSYTMLEVGLTPSTLTIALTPTLVAVAYLLEQRRRMRSVALRAAPWSEWLLCGGLLVLAQLVVRDAFLCLVPLCFMLRRLQIVWPLRTERLVGWLGVVLLLVAFHDHVVVGYGGVAQAVEIIGDDLAPRAFPEELTGFMREAKIEGRVLNDGKWGGYLIWQLWPACHVFMDTRQDLTPEMWPVFLGSQHAHTRPWALMEAHRRWGLELAVFRGPTFPLIVAPPEWLLLYKAGDQELYQHRDGAHAADNLARTDVWLARQLGRPVAQAERAAVTTELGARRWLAATVQRRSQQTLRTLIESERAGDREEAALLQSQLAFESGDYGAARTALRPLLSIHPDAMMPLYRYALSSYALGDLEQARVALGRLVPLGDQLSAAQRGRLALLERALATRR